MKSHCHATLEIKIDVWVEGGGLGIESKEFLPLQGECPKGEGVQEPNFIRLNLLMNNLERTFPESLLHPFFLISSKILSKSSFEK